MIFSYNFYDPSLSLVDIKKHFVSLSLLRKWSSSSSSNTSSTAVVAQPVIPTPVVVPTPESPAETSSQNAEVTDGEWTYDPNEPRYCLCNQVSYGDMVACDNEDVSMSIQGVIEIV